MTTGPAATSASQAIVRRWLTAVALRASAGDVAARGTPVEAAAGLVSADAAGETALGILADLSGAVSKQRDSHERLIELALQTVDEAGTAIPLDVLRAIRVAHGDRNRVVHHGQEPGPRMVEEAIAAVDGLLTVLGIVLPALGAVPPGSGVASAIATLVDIPELAEQLVAGDAAIAAGDVRGALTASAIGHAILLSRALPPLKSDRHRFAGSVGRTPNSAASRRRSGATASGSVRSSDGWSRWLSEPAPPTTRVSRSSSAAQSRVSGGWLHHLPGDGRTPEERTIPLPRPRGRPLGACELGRTVLRLWEMRALVEGDAQTAASARWPSQ